MISQQQIGRVNPFNRAKFLLRHGERQVYIVTNQWGAYWKENRCGYTDDITKAGAYTLREAWSASGHCGPEKGIHYQFVPINK